MNFKEFCEQAKVLDLQEITTTNSFVINFSKPGGTAFSIDPEAIVCFLIFLSENHEKCRNTIEEEPRFSISKTYLRYQEKPYRSLYKLVSDDPKMKIISSLGGSQTKELTKVLTKLISYSAKVSYIGVDETTLFDKKTVDTALKNMPQDLRNLANSCEEPISTDRRVLFEDWLRRKKLSEKTIKSYAGTSINIADDILLKHQETQLSLYKIDSLENVKKAVYWLKDNLDWKERNDTGNGMYQSGVEQYLVFLNDHNIVYSLFSLPKPFLLLAGISGTGKTRFVRTQACLSNGWEIGDSRKPDNYELVAVRPDWHEPSDLLGYVSRINGENYIPTKFLEFLVAAWREVFAKGGTLSTVETGTRPYWLCLDEMNLAPVEQYFADYLSILESRKWDGGTYSSLSIISDNLELVRTALDIDENEPAWQAFEANQGIPLPPNLIVAGTVNMDETTHGFSRKVIDRALTIDFQEFFPNDFDVFFGNQKKPMLLSFPTLSEVTKDDLPAVDNGGIDSKSVEFLKAVNNVLKNTPFELAYRALNELLLSVTCFAPESDEELQAVWDDFLMQKVLPRIEGDSQKLKFIAEAESETLESEELKANEKVHGKGSILHQLFALMETDLLKDIWDGKKRPDLLQDTEDLVGCRSRKKLLWMMKRLKASHFTDFWV